jgi:hypothetical protein
MIALAPFRPGLCRLCTARQAQAMGFANHRITGDAA